MRQFLSEIAAKLQEAKVDSARLEARLLTAHVLNVDPNELLFAISAPSEEQQAEIYRLVSERTKHRPICKIVGHKSFYKYDFIVNEDVLSPRPDTEILVEAAIAEAQKRMAPRIIDFGTGSGCIILSVLGDVKTAIGVAVDKSEKALAVAEDNGRRLNLDSRVKFIHTGWFDDDFISKIGTDYDIVVSNPPYIPSEDIASLDRDVRDYDPLMALDGGADGMYHYRKIAETSFKILKPGGLIFLEGGINQEEEIEKIFIEAGFKSVEILADLSGINRCIILKK